jgi:hypothetical protein
MKMRRRPISRGSNRGFMVAEALVSLSVAALTLVLLTSATWGLRQASSERDVAFTAASDWLTARRALQAWAAAANSPGLERSEGWFEGTATSVRMIIPASEAGPNRPHQAGLSISQADGVYTLTAYRDIGSRDTRMRTDALQTTPLIVSDKPIQLAFLGRDLTSASMVWRYEADPANGLPDAIAIEVDGKPQLVARLLNNKSKICLAANGATALETESCALR